MLRALALRGACRRGACRAQEPASPGITDDAVRIGISGPLTGPVAALGAIADGDQDTGRSDQCRRRRQDGVTARRERSSLIVEDDGLDPQRTLTNVRKLAEREEVFAVLATAGTPNNQAIGRYIDAARASRNLVHVFRRP